MAPVISLHSRSRWRDFTTAELSQIHRWMLRDRHPIPHDFTVEWWWRADYRAHFGEWYVPNKTQDASH